MIAGRGRHGCERGGDVRVRTDKLSYNKMFVRAPFCVDITLFVCLFVCKYLSHLPFFL